MSKIFSFIEEENYFEDDEIEDRISFDSFIPEVHHAPLPIKNSSPRDIIDEGIKIRKEFPESWIYDSFSNETSGY